MKTENIAAIILRIGIIMGDYTLAMLMRIEYNSRKKMLWMSIQGK